jgi:diguanylate cyclase (GGDEF)-like protein
MASVLPLDELTRVLTRSAGEELLQRVLRRGAPVAVLFVDIDHFKKVNDNYGHDVGDIVLKRFASFIKSTLRESDLAFRLGGEEFMVMMPYTTKEQALEIAERLRKTIKEEGCITIGSERICYTFSGGITDTNESGHDLATLLKVADEKLYSAKRNGRDLIVV